jgi:hypothetical protein
MDADYDGRQVVGIDLHGRRSVIVRMAEAGERLGWAGVDNDPMALPRPSPRPASTRTWSWRRRMAGTGRSTR